MVLWRYKPKIVAVTGSVGKTSTKDAIYTVLKSRVSVRKSEKSFNSEVGVPLTVLGLPNAWSSPLGWIENLFDGLLMCILARPYPEWLVLEVGADRPGDIKRVGRWVRPDIAVMTRLPDVPVHVEFFGSTEAVIEEKRELRRALKEGGTLIVNADDPVLREEPVSATQRRQSYGFSEGADMRGFDAAYAYTDEAVTGVCMRVRWQGKEEQVTLLGTVGRHHLTALLAALTVGAVEGLRFEAMADALRTHEGPPGRMKLLQGLSGSIIIDDTYNASPVAAAEALATLSGIRVKGRRIAVLGDMMELGDRSVEEHAKVGKLVAGSADVFVAVGVRMQRALAAAHETGMPVEHTHTAPDSEAAGSMVRELLRAGDVVLFKGSQSTRMERAVAQVLMNPSIDRSKLVRQDEEWKAR